MANRRDRKYERALHQPEGSKGLYLMLQRATTVAPIAGTMIMTLIPHQRG